MDQLALESRSIQSLIDKTSIPEAKMYVGGVRSTQDERLFFARFSDAALRLTDELNFPPHPLDIFGIAITHPRS